MVKIYKYPLFYHSVPELLRLPKDAEITSFGVQMQNNPKTVMWAKIDTDNEIEERIFFIAMTGREIPGKIVKVYNTLQTENNIVMTLLELSDVVANDPQKDTRINLAL